MSSLLVLRRLTSFRPYLSLKTPHLILKRGLNQGGRPINQGKKGENQGDKRYYATKPNFDAIRKAFDNPTLQKPSGPSVGLFGIPELVSPEGFEILTQRAIAEAEQIASALDSKFGFKPTPIHLHDHSQCSHDHHDHEHSKCSHDHHDDYKHDHDHSKCSHDHHHEPIKVAPYVVEDSPGGVIKAMDQISNVLCSVVDVAEFVRNTHPDLQFVQAAHHCFTSISTYMQHLNTKASFNQILKQTMKDPKLVSKLTEEEKTVGDLFLYDFESSGPPEQRDSFMMLTEEVHSKGFQFVQSANGDSEFVFDSQEEIKALPSRIAKMMEKKNGKYILPNYRGIGEYLLKHWPDPNIRKKIFTQLHQADPVKIQLLEKMLMARYQLGKLVGNKSYANFFLADKIAKTPENVIEKLNLLSEKLKSKVAANVEDLIDEKIRVEGRKENPPVLEAWEREYYANERQKTLFPLNTAQISNYFSVGSCFMGIAKIMHSLFGLHVKVEELKNGEAWDPSVQKLAVYEEDGSLNGYIYCDLFARNGKNFNAGHFTIRCSRKISDTEIQHPVVTLAMNFYPPGALSTSSNASSLDEGEGRNSRPEIEDIDKNELKNIPSLLRFSEVETLFHEMGHAIHSMLARTRFQNVSGTRCKIDFVETPSLLMEYFCRDYRVLKLFAKHYKTGETIPPHMMKSTLMSRDLFSALDFQHQIMYSILDQVYHGKEVGEKLLTESGKNGKPKENKEFITSKVYEELYKKYLPMACANGTAWQTHFAHLYGYGAGYYSYIFCKAFASQIWSECFSMDPLSREMGEKYRQEVLAHGGGKDPIKMLQNILDTEVLSFDSLIREFD